MASMAAATPAPSSTAAPVAAPVAILDFWGAGEGLNGEFQEAVYAELEKLDRFAPSLVSVSSAEILPLDTPPKLEEGFRYAITGAFYRESGFPTMGRLHFQLWLWDMGGPGLVYTNELACEEIAEGWEFLPGLIRRLVDRFLETYPAEPPPPPPPPPPDPEAWRKKWFYLGLRAGEGLLFPASPDPAPGGAASRRFVPWHFAFEGGVYASLQFLPFLSLQGGADAELNLFVQPAAAAGAPSGFTADQLPFFAAALKIPLFFKVNLNLGPYRLAPLGGVYWTLPLAAGSSGGESPPLGIILGLRGEARLSGGNTGFVELRFSSDAASFWPAWSGFSGRRLLTIALGVEAGFFTRRPWRGSELPSLLLPPAAPTAP
jgi:hypothetical protein